MTRSEKLHPLQQKLEKLRFTKSLPLQYKANKKDGMLQICLRNGHLNSFIILIQKKENIVLNSRQFLSLFKITCIKKNYWL